MHRPWLLHMQYLIPVLLLLLSASWAGASIDDGEFTFDGFFGNDLTMDGEALVSDGLLRLTSGQNQSQGHAFYTCPLNFTTAGVPTTSSVPSFSTTFVFAIIPQYRDLSSHGLAFVLSSTKELFSALPGQFLGLLNEWNYGNSSNHLLAIKLDTILNMDFNDIDDNHIGIDVNSLNSVASASAGYYTSDGEFHNLNLSSTKPMQVWVDYDSKHTMLNVTIAPYFLSTKPSRPLLSITYNLSLVCQPQQCTLGFPHPLAYLTASITFLAGASSSMEKLQHSATPPYLSRLSKNSRSKSMLAHTASKTILCIVLLPIIAFPYLFLLLLLRST